MGLPAAGLLPPARSLSPSPSLPPYLRNPAQQGSSCWSLWTKWGLFLPSWDPDMQPPVVSLSSRVPPLHSLYVRCLCPSSLRGKSLCLSSLILQNRCHSQPPLRARAAFIPVLSCVFACPLGLDYVGLFNGIALLSYMRVKHHTLPHKYGMIFSVKDEKEMKGWSDNSVNKSCCSSKDWSSAAMGGSQPPPAPEDPVPSDLWSHPCTSWRSNRHVHIDFFY